MRSMGLIERLKFEIDYQADQAVFDLIQTDQRSKIRSKVRRRVCGPWIQNSNQVRDQVRRQVWRQVKEENL